MLESIEDSIIQKSRISLSIFFILSVIICVLAMKSYTGSEMADDGAFFLRYAENMLHGEFWVWNLGEAPVWGASAPLYPLFIAIPMFFGVEPVSALFGTGIFLSTMSFSLLATYFASRFGFIIGFIFLIFVVTDVGLIYFSVGGLESPLVYVLLSLAVWGLLENKAWWFMGIVAGLLMVHKLDMVPIGGMLLIAFWIQEKRFPLKAIILAMIIALSWYIFAWLYFGAPVPNSFLTKSLHQNNFNYSIDWTWFGSFVFFNGIHFIFLIGSIIAIFLSRHFRVPILFLTSILMIHLIAYTIKYPFEPYNWYAMPSVFSVIILSIFGINVILNYIKSKTNIIVVIVICITTIILIIFFNYEKIMTEKRAIISFINNQEFDRAEAGRWVDKNTPKNFNVATWWGNPGYFSNRYVLDGSFLNRKYEDGDIVKNYMPEILIIQNNPTSTPMDPVFASLDKVEYKNQYKVVKIFDKSYKRGMDYFFAVLAREDILAQITNIEIPKDLMKYVTETILGNNYGMMKPISATELFIHPGWTTPTTFKFNSNSFKSDFDIDKSTKIKLFFKIDPKLSKEAIARKAGNVNVIVKNGSQVLCKKDVKLQEPLFCVIDNGTVEIIVDNNGNPDSDWLLFSVEKDLERFEGKMYE